MKKVIEKKIRIIKSVLFPMVFLAGAGSVMAGEEETEKVRVMIVGYEDDEIDFADNVLTQWVQEQVKQELSIDIEFVKVLQQEFSWETIINGQDPPDIIYGIQQDAMLDYAGRGLLADLTEVYEDYGDNIRAMGDFQYMGNIGGIQYALVSRRDEVLASYGYVCAYIRKDWLELLGMEIPATKEELIEYLYAVKEKNPGGAEEVVPWAMGGGGDLSRGYLNFVGSYVTLDSERDAYIYSGEYLAVAPGALEGIRQLNTLYNDGIISDQFFNDLEYVNTRYARQVERGEAGFLVEKVNSAWGYFIELSKNLEEAAFIPVQCFELANGGYRNPISPEYVNNGSGYYICVPAASQDKAEACVRYLNWMANPEVSENIMYGPGHQKNEYGVPKLLSPSEYVELGYPKSPRYAPISLMNRHLAYQDDPDGMISAWRTYAMSGFEEDEWWRQQWEILQEGQFHFPAFSRIPQAELDYGESVEKDIIQYVYQLISCKPEDFDGLQETFYRELEQKGLSDILEDRAKCYDLLEQN